jgi:hypothetical protein
MSRVKLLPEGHGWPYPDEPSYEIGGYPLSEIVEPARAYTIVARNWFCVKCRRWAHSKYHLGGWEFCPNCRAWLNPPKPKPP